VNGEGEQSICVVIVDDYQKAILVFGAHNLIGIKCLREREAIKNSNKKILMPQMLKHLLDHQTSMTQTKRLKAESFGSILVLAANSITNLTVIMFSPILNFCLTTAFTS